MARRNFASDPLLKVQLQRPVYAPHNLDPYLRAAVTLAVVRVTFLARHALDPFDLALDLLQGLLHELRDGVLAITLEDEFRVPQPHHGVHHQVEHELVLVQAFARHDMCKQAFGLETADDEALDNLALLPVGRKFLVALCVECVPQLFELVSPPNACRGDEPVVNTNSWNSVMTSPMSSTLFSKTPSHNAEPAPYAERDVSFPVKLDGRFVG